MSANISAHNQYNDIKTKNKAVWKWFHQRFDHFDTKSVQEEFYELQLLTFKMYLDDWGNEKKIKKK